MIKVYCIVENYQQGNDEKIVAIYDNLHDGVERYNANKELLEDCALVEWTTNLNETRLLKRQRNCCAIGM